jgi:spermidine synthase
MTRPWNVIDRVATEEGLLELRQRGEKDFLITVGGRVLMNSTAQRSEQALGQLACAHLKGRHAPRVLVGGLGMGYTLKSVLDTLPASGHVIVAELNPVVVKWCQDPLAALNRNAVSDARVTVVVADVAHVIRNAARNTGGKRFDAIVLDLYTGPYAHDPNTALYGSRALETTKAALEPGAVLAIWGENYDPSFENRLRATGLAVTVQRPGRGRFRHVVYLGKRQPLERNSRKSTSSRLK